MSRKGNRTGAGEYATETGEIDVSCVRARGVGTAVFIEHIGGSGDIAAVGVGTKEFAEDLAGELNLIFNTFRSVLGDAAEKAGRFANESRRREEALRVALRRVFRCENWATTDTRANVADALGMTVAAVEKMLEDAS